MSTHKIAGLFAGIGGIELGFQRALGSDVETTLLCEWWEPAQQVLTTRFPDVEVHPDVRELTDLPAETTIVAAGFPCTDLSQAGRTAGIEGVNSGLVKHVFEVLQAVRRSGRSLPTLLIENVPNMLALNRGHAMRYLVSEIEALGYRWAYRVVDSRFTGVPQRRRRVILVASTELDPRGVVFADDAGARPEDHYGSAAYGFYWTEGLRGLGWAQDAVPTLKGGSTLGIASPPAIWVPSAEAERRLVKPSVDDAEVLQGFDRGWTDVFGEDPRLNRPRWKLIGNAVTAHVSEWVAGRIAAPGDPMGDSSAWEPAGAWPTAAWGEGGDVYRVDGISEYPEHRPYTHLLDVVDADSAETLTPRGAAGFWSRLQRGNLGRHPGFREDVARFVEGNRSSEGLARAV